MPKKDPTYDRIERALFKETERKHQASCPNGKWKSKTNDAMCQQKWKIL